MKMANNTCTKNLKMCQCGNLKMTNNTYTKNLKMWKFENDHPNVYKKM